MASPLFGTTELTREDVLTMIPSVPVVAGGIGNPTTTVGGGIGSTVAQHQPKDLVFPGGVVARAEAAIEAGSHLILAGPPGTGKSTLAVLLANSATKNGYMSSYKAMTATSDWTTFDTLGGYMPTNDGRGLVFHEGLILRSIREDSWCIIDELNRANIDRSIGALISLLAGSEQAVEISLSYLVELADGEGTRLEPVRIRRDSSATSSFFDHANATYVIGTNWRVVATMNTLDRSNLFALTAAFARRFATVFVGIPPADQVLDVLGVTDVRARDLYKVTLSEKLGDVFNPRPLGPAITKDAWRYASLRQAAGGGGALGLPEGVEPLLESIELYILPQYSGLEQDQWALLRDQLVLAMTTGADPADASKSREILNANLDQRFHGIQGAG